MTLATVGPDGRPSARIVLLKAFDAAGFTFHTNYDSRKGRELAANPHAALLFFWPDWSARCASRGRSRAFRRKNRMIISAPGRREAGWALGVAAERVGGEPGGAGTADGRADPAVRGP